MDHWIKLSDLVKDCLEWALDRKPEEKVELQNMDNCHETFYCKEKQRHWVIAAGGKLFVCFNDGFIAFYMYTSPFHLFHSVYSYYVNLNIGHTFPGLITTGSQLVSLLNSSLSLLCPPIHSTWMSRALPFCLCFGTCHTFLPSVFLCLPRHGGKQNL